MKRIFAVMIVGIFSLCPLGSAEDAPAMPAVEPMAAVEAPAAELVAVSETVPAPIFEPAAETPAPALNPENLEFVSGEVASLDESAKSLTIKLYGETENAPSDKMLLVTVDENTDVTDGEQDRELKSLTAGTEVDVEYDPSNNKATYIFVY